MGSGGSQALWSPSYGAGAVRDVLEIDTTSNQRHLAENHILDRTVDDGGTLKREQSN